MCLISQACGLQTWRGKRTCPTACLGGMRETCSTWHTVHGMRETCSTRNVQQCTTSGARTWSLCRRLGGGRARTRWLPKVRTACASTHPQAAHTCQVLGARGIRILKPRALPLRCQQASLQRLQRAHPSLHVNAHMCAHVYTHGHAHEHTHSAYAQKLPLPPPWSSLWIPACSSQFCMSAAGRATVLHVGSRQGHSKQLQACWQCHSKHVGSRQGHSKQKADSVAIGLSRGLKECGRQPWMAQRIQGLADRLVEGRKRQATHSSLGHSTHAACAHHGTPPSLYPDVKKPSRDVIKGASCPWERGHLPIYLMPNTVRSKGEYRLAVSKRI